jgi:hypothetical protein
LKIPSIKRAGGMVQGIGPEFKPQYHKKKKKKVFTSRRTVAPFLSAILATWEDEIRRIGSKFKASLGRELTRPHLNH